MKKIAEKLTLQFAVIYTAVTVSFSFCMYMEGASVDALQYLKLFIMFLVLWGITFLRGLLDKFQWGLRQHYLLKRILFMPLYLGVTLWTLLHFGDPFENSLKDGIFIACVFLAAFAVSLLICLPRVRRQEQVYEEILQAYQEKLKEGEQ